MRTYEEEIIKQKVIIVKCDFCDFTVRRNYLGYCCVCKKDICHNHSTPFYEDGSEHVTHMACPDHKQLVQEAFDFKHQLESGMPDIDDIIKHKME